MRIYRALALGLVLTLSPAVSALADYEIPVSTTTQGGGRGSSDTQSLTFAIGQPTPLVAASNSKYDLRTGLMRLLLDVRPPVILHSPPVTAVPDRTALLITAAIGDDRTGVDKARVFYREGGAGTYRQAAMSRDGSSFSASLPPSAVTERGILYYIEAADSAGNISCYPASAPDSIIDVRVWFEDLPSGFEMPAGKYRMVSLPGSTDASPDLVLADDLGSYDKKVWRLGRWSQAAGCSSGCYAEYPDVPDMDRGRAFWLISSRAVTFDFSGLSTFPESRFKIHLDKGWNQIGTPFAFPTDWLSTEILFGGATYALNTEYAVDADTIFVEDNLVFYDGTYHGQESTMAPWQGYWIYNGSTQAVDLLISPSPSIPLLASPQALRDGLDPAIDLVVTSPGFPERNGLVGLSPGAREAWDPMDHREPPPFGDYVRLVFDRPGWGKHAGTFMTDIRPLDGDGAQWDFSVEASAPVAAQLTLASKGRFAQDWVVYLYDLARGLRIGIDDLPYAFDVDGGRRFSLITGTEEFIRRQEDEAGISLVPQIVAVAPNPFRRGIEIAYFAPRSGPVELEIFSVEGRLVKALRVAEGGAGIRRVAWQGDSEGRGEVAPGLYVVRLTAGTIRNTTKIVKIQ